MESIADMTHRHVVTRVLPVKILSCYGISILASLFHPANSHINRTSCGFLKEIFNLFLKKITFGREKYFGSLHVNV